MVLCRCSEAGENNIIMLRAVTTAPARCSCDNVYHVLTDEYCYLALYSVESRH